MAAAHSMWRSFAGCARAGRAARPACAGVWGFHGDHAPHGDRLLQLRRHVPVVTIIVDTPERIAASFEIVDELTDEAGLVTSEMVPAMAVAQRRRAPARRAAPRPASRLILGGSRYALGRAMRLARSAASVADGLYLTQSASVDIRWSRRRLAF